MKTAFNRQYLSRGKRKKNTVSTNCLSFCLFFFDNYQVTLSHRPPKKNRVLVFSIISAYYLKSALVLRMVS